jgi:hypothetical protein
VIGLPDLRCETETALTGFSSCRLASARAGQLDSQKGGRFRIVSSGDVFRNKQFYWPETNILITRLLHADGISEIEDYIPIGALGTSPDQLVRRVRVVRGSRTPCDRVSGVGQTGGTGKKRPIYPRLARNSTP